MHLTISIIDNKINGIHIKLILSGSFRNKKKVSIYPVYNVILKTTYHNNEKFPYIAF